MVELQEDLAVQQALLVVVRLLEGSGGENGLRAGLAAWRRPPLSEFFWYIYRYSMYRQCMIVTLAQ